MGHLLSEGKLNAPKSHRNLYKLSCINFPRMSKITEFSGLFSSMYKTVLTAKEMENISDYKFWNLSGVGICFYVSLKKKMYLFSLLSHRWCHGTHSFQAESHQLHYRIINHFAKRTLGLQAQNGGQNLPVIFAQSSCWCEWNRGASGEGREAGSHICSHAHSLQLIKGNMSSLLSEPTNAALCASED